MYKIYSSEQTRHKASTFETKALLYLAGFHPDSEKMEFFIVDFYNDLTGTDRLSEEVWDLQSKATLNQGPSAIGRNLVTLYKNHISDFEFHHYILFFGGPSSRVVINGGKKVFGINNIRPDALEKIKMALEDECSKKDYIDKSRVTKKSIDEFLERVTFVIDDKEEVEYIKSLITVDPKYAPDNLILKQIFEEIRNTQSSKKDHNEIEGVELSTFSEYKRFNRHIETKKIRLLILHRILNYNFEDKSIPRSFTRYLDSLDDIDRDSFIDSCQERVTLTLFDNSNAKHFWKFFENILICIMKDEKSSINEIYEKLDKEILKKNPHLDDYSARYFIAIVRDDIGVR